MKTKFTCRKYNGDDLYSWAVFRKGDPRPIVTGLSRQQASYYKARFEKEASEKCSTAR